MKVLILGGSRFVGPYVVDMLLDRGVEVTVFNRGNFQSPYKGKVKLIKGDRNAKFDIKGHFDTIIDTCAYTGLHTKTAIEQLDFDFFLNIGTVGSYKKAGLYPLSEDAVLGDWPIWGDYNKGKVDGEHVLAKSGIKYASLRPVYVFGPKNFLDR